MQQAEVIAMGADYPWTARFVNADYRRIFQVSRYVAARELRRLVEGGFLRMQGKGRGAHYLPRPILKATRKRAK